MAPTWSSKAFSTGLLVLGFVTSLCRAEPVGCRLFTTTEQVVYCVPWSEARFPTSGSNLTVDSWLGRFGTRYILPRGELPTSTSAKHLTKVTVEPDHVHGNGSINNSTSGRGLRSVTNQGFETTNLTAPEQIGVKKAAARNHKHKEEWEDAKNGKPIMATDSSVTVINATPFRWHRGYIHSYQMVGWEKMWPEYIEPGDSIRRITRPHGGSTRQDTAAEVAYHLEGTSQPMSFMLERTKGGGEGWTFLVRFLEDLESMGNAKLSMHDLGWHTAPGGVGFVLAGKEGHFISNDPPADWMQSMLPEIGHLQLREVVMPRSHHAGLWKITDLKGLALPCNTQTQDVDLYTQIGIGGVRVLDVRPLRYHGNFRESHGTKVLGVWHGAAGASLDEMIDMTNDFNDRHPGELFIWDLHATETMDADAPKHKHSFKKLEGKGLEELYEKLKGLKHRVSIPDNEDISTWPLNDFIANKTSAVIIRVDQDWLEKARFPGGKEGFVTNQYFPTAHKFSNTPHAGFLAKDQVEGIMAKSPRPSMTYIMDYLLTKTGWRSVLPGPNLREKAKVTWAKLYSLVWDMSTDERYPSWISMDGMHSDELKALAMAMNKCLGARNCGELKGKVKIKND